MSDRADVIIIRDGVLTLVHHRWAATILLAELLSGPDPAITNLSEDVGNDDDTEDPHHPSLTDILAGVVIDIDRKILVVAGPAEVIGSGGFVSNARRHVAEQEVAPALAKQWPGWRIGYEPSDVVAPLLAHARSFGFKLASLNDPDQLADALGRPRWTRLSYEAGPLVAESFTPAQISVELANQEIDCEILSVRAANEVRNAKLATWGDYAALSTSQLAARGVSEKPQRELAEVFAEERSSAP
jgi:hypothetical protein